MLARQNITGLWTTLSSSLKPYEFDSFRVFIWSLRRHRYETAYIERKVVGYYPVEVIRVDQESGDRLAEPRFSLILRDDDNLLYRRTYAFQGYRVKLVEESQWIAPEEGTAAAATTTAARGGGKRPS